MKFPWVSTSSNFGKPTFLSSSSLVLAKLLCVYACFLIHACFLILLVSYNGASNSCVVEKFVVLVFIVNTAFFIFYSSFVLFRNCIPMIKITPLLFFCSLFFFLLELCSLLTSSWLESLKHKWLRLPSSSSSSFFFFFLIQNQVRECNRVCDY